MRILAAGAGIGLRTGGAAVTLWSNGTGVLRDLGVSLDGAGSRIDRP